MATKMISQHKRMAQGDMSVGFARGGSVVKGLSMPKLPKIGGGSGLPESPLTVAKRNNGVVGMKKGGKTK